MAASVNASRKVRALRLARQRIDEGKSQFVCLALEHVAERDTSLANACRQLREYIGKALGPCMTLNTWYKVTYRTQVLPDMRVTRLAWIDWMIECLEGKR